MPREPKPWRRKDVNNSWYAQVDMKKRYLAPPEATEAQANAVLKRIIAEHPVLKAADIFDRFLEFTKEQVEQGVIERGSHKFNQWHLTDAARAFGHVSAAEVRRTHVDSWLDTKDLSATNRNKADGVVNQAFNWAADKAYLLKKNPLRLIEKPAPGVREDILTDDQVKTIIASTSHDEQFRDLIVAMALTSCRPSEIYNLTAADVDLKSNTWRVKNKTGRNYRTVRFTEVGAPLSKKLMRRHPTEWLFLNTKDGKWTKVSVGSRMRGLAKKLGIEKGACVDAIRFLFTTNALERGVDVATLAELVGHEDTSIIMRVYFKLGKRTRHMSEAAKKAARVGS